MYCACYLYRVPVKNIERFLRITSEAGEIYRRYGAIGSTMIRITDAAAKYGCLGLVDLYQSNADEAVFMGMDSFANLTAFKTLSEKIDADPRIGELFEEVQTVIEFGKIVRWEADDSE